MGYRILYECTGEANRIALWKIRMKHLGISAICVVLAILAIWTSGIDFSATAGAMEEMADAFRDGADFQEAFSVFCIQILEGAECG